MFLKSLRFALFFIFAASGLALLAPASASAETIQIPICNDGKAKCYTGANRGRIGLISGGAGGTYIQVADALRKAIDGYQVPGKDWSLRVVPMVGRGSLQNLNDLLYFERTDVGLVQADVLALLEQLNAGSPDKPYEVILNRVSYIAPMYNEEIHVVCRRGACGRHFGAETEDVVVNIGPPGSGTSMTAFLIASQLGFDPKLFRTEAYSDALSIMKASEGKPTAERIDAMFYVSGKPAKIIRDIGPDEGLQLVEMLEPPKGLEGFYVDAFFDDADGYAGVMTDSRMRTLAVPAILAVYGGNYGSSERKESLDAFCKALMEKVVEIRRKASNGAAHRKLIDWDPSTEIKGLAGKRHPCMAVLLQQGG